MDGEEPKTIGTWSKVASLGEGSFGTVSLWMDSVSKQRLAIKKCRFMNPRLISQKQRERWENEVVVMKRMRNTNIIKFKPLPADLLATLSRYNPSRLSILSMEYCSGGNLRQLLNEPINMSGLPELEIKFIICDITNAVSYLHSQAVIHRDIKPENIVLEPHSSAFRSWIYKLIDLGFAKEMNDATISFVGTQHYLAPEVSLGERYTYTVDYWSMGCLIFEIITGCLPFLPDDTHFNRFQEIKKKESDQICIYRDDGILRYGSEIVFSNHVNYRLRSKLEVWLRHVLQYDPSRRRERFPFGVEVFDYLRFALSKTYVQVFCLYKNKFYFYEVGGSTKVGDLKAMVEGETGIPASEQIILSEKEWCDETLVFDLLDKGPEPVLYLARRGSWIDKDDPIQLPQLLKTLFENPKAEYGDEKLRRIFAESVHFVGHLLSRLSAFVASARRYIDHTVGQIKRLKIGKTRVSLSLNKLISSIESFDSLRRKIQEGRPVQGDHLPHEAVYRECVKRHEEMIRTVERDFEQKKKLEVTVKTISKYEDKMEHRYEKLKEVLEVDESVNDVLTETTRLIEKAIEEIRKDRSVKRPCSFIFVQINKAMKEVLGRIFNKDLENFIHDINECIRSKKEVAVWIDDFLTHLDQVYQKLVDNEATRLNCFIEEASKKPGNRVRKINDEISAKIEQEFRLLELNDSKCARLTMTLPEPMSDQSI